MSRKKATINSEEREVYLEQEDSHDDRNDNRFGNLRELIFLGRIEKIVDIGSYKFKLKTLNGNQQMLTLSKTMQYGEGERLAILRNATLAESISDVNGVTLDKLYDGNEDLDVIDKKMHVISNLQSSIIDKLYIEYDGLVKEANNLLEDTSLKK